MNLNGFQLINTTGGGNSQSLNGQLSGSSGTLSLTQFNMTISGVSANTFTGLTVTSGATTPNTRYALNLNKPAGLDAIAGPLLVNCTTANDFTVVQWSQNDQIDNNSVVTLNPTTGSSILRLNGYTDMIGGLISQGAGNSIVENAQTSSPTTGKLTVSPSAGAVYTFGGILRDGYTGSVGTLSFGLAGPGQEILTGAEAYSGATTVNSGTLTVNGSLANANITIAGIGGGDLNGAGTINFGNGSPNGEIVVNSSGTLDASGGLLFNIAGLTGSPVDLANLTGGGKLVIPAGGLESILTPASQGKYTLSDVSNILIATALANNTWKVDASGNWSNSANWVGGMVPNAASTPANFGTVITAPRTVTLDIPVTVGSVNFNNNNQYTLLDTTGTNNITLNNGAEDATIGVAAGSHVINAGIIIAGNNILDVTVAPSAGTLTIPAPLAATAGS